MGFVTGGGGGLGHATAEQILAESDATRCALVDLGLGLGSELIDSFGSDRVRWFETDVSDQAAVAASAVEVFEWSDDLIGLVNAAGIINITPSSELSPEEWRSVLGVHLDGTLFWSQQAARAWRRRGTRGAIVNLSSVAAHFGYPRRLPYACAKAAIEELTRTLAVEWAADQIRVNAVAPGFIETEMVRDIFQRGLISREESEDLHAIGRLGRPEEVAAAIVFLLSDGASNITAETLMVDGGFSAIKLPQATEQKGSR